MSLNDELLAALLMQQVGGGGKKTAVDKTLGVEGAAADAKAVGDALSKKASTADVEKALGRKVPLNYGAANAGKHLIVGADGNVTAAYTGQSGDIELPDMAALQQIAASGEAARYFAAGDLVENSWMDTAISKSYDNPLRINHFSTETLEDGTKAPGMWLQAKYAHPFGVQFSQYQAIKSCDDGLTAGTYSFTFGDSVGSKGFVAKGVSFHFTLTKDVPAGGKIAGLRGSWDADKPYDTLKIMVYAADSRTVMETVGIAEGADGTSLGTLTLAGDENLNSIHRFSYGDNCWSRSAMRQYLNSDKPKGEWWTPQSRWDLAPDQLASKDGYLCGIDPTLLAAIKPVKVQTYRNTVCYDDKAKGNTPDITYDKVTLPSIEQMFITPQQAGEGEAQEYYVHLNGTGTKYAQWGTYPELRTYAVESRTATQYVRLRSASRGNGCITWFVYSSGYVGTSSAVFAWRVAPLVFIG